MEFVVTATVAVLLLVLCGLLYFSHRKISEYHEAELQRIEDKYRCRKEDIEAKYRRKKERLDRLRKKAEGFSPEQIRTTLKMSYSDPEFLDYATLTDDFTALEQDYDAMTRAWTRVGETMQEVLDAAPPPEDCEGMTPDEFEEAIRENLRKKERQP